MPLHVLKQIQRLPISLSEAWDFFSNPANLALITPPSLGFEIKSDLPESIYAGQIISYRVRPLLGIPVTWVTEIAHVSRPTLFVDRQLIGPYRIWHHEHHFTEIDGGIEMRDIVHYALPFGVIGDLFHPIIIKPRLNHIFNFRRSYLEEKFG